jgi:hypothetical protein
MITLLRTIPLLALLGAVLGTATPAAAQEGSQVTITGRIRQAQGDWFDPTKVPITLNVFEGVTSFDPVSTIPASDGSFAFTVTAAPDRIYFFGAEYQQVAYSETRSSTTLNDPLLITVFPSTHDTSVLDFRLYAIIAGGPAVAANIAPDDRCLLKNGCLEMLEFVEIRNDSGMTVVPNFNAVAESQMLSFLRFGLPEGAYNLAVDSNLVGGDILVVDRGFALTTPITPTDERAHVFSFRYFIDFKEGSLDLSRTMRFGADEFNFVGPVGTGRPESPQLLDLGVADRDGRLLRILEGADIEAGEFLILSMSGLPTPTIWARMVAVAGDRYVTYGAPGLVVAAMLVMMLYSFLRRRFAFDLSADPVAQETLLLQRAAELEEQRRSGSLSDHRYGSARAEIKQALMDLRVRQHDTGEEVA